jgi:hypothetical protein
MILAQIQLARELSAWRSAGRAARLWWRDDDARQGTPALDRLLALSDRHHAPLAVAAIPGPGVREIAREAFGRPQVVVIQHGVDHVNRQEGPVAGEFPSTASFDEISVRLDDAWAVFEDAPCTRKVFAPPWNHVHRGLEAALEAAGYVAWSAWGEIAPTCRLSRIDTHLDLLRWRGGPRFRGRARFIGALCDELACRRRSGLWDAPIGLLTHHLDHDAAAWAYLDEFLSWVRDEAALSWLAPDDLFARPAWPALELVSARRRRA